MIPPVLIIGFRRPTELQTVLQSCMLRHAGSIYIWIDHPRPGRIDDLEPHSAVRRIVQKAADDPRVRTNFANANVGLARAIPSAIDWVLQDGHDRLMILEDDCVPGKDFFPFVEEMLSRFEDDQSVAMVAGNNFLPERVLRDHPYSYYFSQYVHIWGWATWARAWREYDADLALLSDSRTRSEVAARIHSGAARRFFFKLWEHQRSNPKDDAWASRWMFACLRRNSLCVAPSRNLVENIGFGSSGTHTGRANRYQVRRVEELSWPLRHPQKVEPFARGDVWWFSRMISKNPLRRFYRRFAPTPRLQGKPGTSGESSRWR